MRIKNGLVVGVVLLFIGVAIQPAIAVNPISSDNDDECNLCAKKVSKSQLALLKNSLNRIEKYDIQLSALSKLKPEVAEEYQELSDRITTFTETSKEFNFDWDFPIICKILAYLSLPFFIVSYILYPILLRIPDGSLLWYLWIPIELLLFFPVTVLFLFNCIEFPDMFPD